MLNHKFTSREKTMMVILVLLLLYLLYKITVLDSVQSAVTEAEQAIAAAEDQFKIENAKLQNLKEMQSELDKVDNSGVVSEIPQYDNLPNVIMFMDNVITGTSDYNLSFGSIATSGSLVRRTIGVNFTASSYAQALDKIRAIYACEYRCNIADIAISPVSDTITDGSVNVKITVTFVETTAPVQTSVEASDQEGDQANEQVSDQTSEQANEQTSEQTSDQINDQASE